MTQPTNSEDDDTKEKKRRDVYMSFTSGAKFAMIVAVLVLFIKSM